ncbi:hypothetical protein [uncultured Ruegeria sp.]|uniref:hypothetical protein n=1 Tax=uncultured Ruegeria sp. TaxID=259304 RepID=UPI002618EB34|nr:hypothetical protein [uncultured Ruegeria sp.]
MTDTDFNIAKVKGHVLFYNDDNFVGSKPFTVDLNNSLCGEIHVEFGNSDECGRVNRARLKIGDNFFGDECFPPLYVSSFMSVTYCQEISISFDERHKEAR